MIAVLDQVVIRGGGVSSWGLMEWIIAIIVLAAAIAIMWVALNKFGITIPDWAVKIFWICVVAVVAIVAIHFIMSLL